MDTQQLISELSTILQDQSLLRDNNLEARKNALDTIRYIGKALRVPSKDGDFQRLYHQAQAFGEQLQAIDRQLFHSVRADLQASKFTPESLRTFLNQFTDYTPDQRGQPDYEYNGLDELLENVIFLHPLPSESRERASGMIRYEATPARVILELVDSLRFNPGDVFVDLGSGLGLVTMLVNLLTGVPTVGIEYDPAYCFYAQTCAAELGLSKVSFINADVRKADLSLGTIFYLFTPFINEVFDAVLEKLHRLAKQRPIYVCSYGTCTFELAQLPWLQLRDPAMEHDFKLAIFSSL